MNIFQSHLKHSGYGNKSYSSSIVNARTKQSGSALIVVLLLVIVGSLIAISQAKTTRTDMKIAHNNQLGVQALGMAEAGIYHAFRLIVNDSINLDNELSGIGTDGPGTGGALAAIGSVVDLDTAGIDYRFNNLGGGASDGYYVRAEDNFDETPNNTTDDIDRNIYIISRGRVATAERIIKVRVEGGPPVFGLFGIEEVDLNGATMVDSYDPTLGLYPASGYGNNFANVGSNKLIDVTSSGVIKGSVSSGDEVKGGSSVTGTVTTGAELVGFPPVADCSPYSNSTTPGITGTYDITKLDSDGSLEVTAGGNVTLATGTYCFKKLKLTSGSTLTIDPLNFVTIYMTDDADLVGGGIINAGGTASNLSILSNGKDIKITGGASFFASVYAPRASIEISGGSDFYGTAVGKKVKISGSTTAFHVDESLLNGGVLLASWREINNQ